jgi:hypothetical protein
MGGNPLLQREQLTWLGDTEELRLELFLPPDEVLERIRAVGSLPRRRKLTPEEEDDDEIEPYVHEVIFWWLGVGSRVKGHSFSIWERIGENRLEGTVEPRGEGSLVQYRVRGPFSVRTQAFVWAVCVSAAVILGFSGWPALWLYAIVGPIVFLSVTWVLLNLGHSSRNLLAFFRTLFAYAEIHHPAPLDKWQPGEKS